MKILFHLRGDVVGGAETHTMTLANELAGHGYQIIITTEHKNLFDYVLKARAQSTMAVAQMRTHKDLARKLATWNPDIFQFYHSDFCYRALMSTHRVGFRGKVVEVAHNQTYFHGCCTTYPKDHTDTVVCVSKEVEAFYYSQGGSARTVIIPNGINPKIFYPEKRRPRRGRKLLIGFAGRLEYGAGKGIPQMLDMVRERQKAVELELVGYDQGNYRAALPPNAKIFNFTKDIAPFYRRWDAIISCSPKEGFGLTIAEGYMCGCKVLAYNCGGICGFLRHGDDALIYDTYQGVAEGLDLLIKGQTLNCYPEKFSSDTMAKSYAHLYESLLDGTTSSNYTICNKQLVSHRPEIKTLGVVPQSFYGVKKSIEPYCDVMVPPGSVTGELLNRGVTHVYFGGFSEDAVRDLTTIRRFNPGVTTIVTWQGTFVLGGYNSINTDLFSLMVECCKNKLVDSVLCPHPGVAKALSALLPVHCGILDNMEAAMLTAKRWLEPYREKHSEPSEGEINISMLGSGAPWKNLETGVVACACLRKWRELPVKLHISANRRGDLDRLAKALGTEIVYHPLHHPDHLAPYLEALSRMDLSLCIGMSETFGFAAIESFMVGVPAVVSASHPSMIEAGVDISEHCLVEEIDNPHAVAAKMDYVLHKRRSMAEAGKRCFWSIYDDYSKRTAQST